MKEKHTMYFVSSDGRSIDMDLCCFCTRSDNLIRPVACPHYEDDFENNSCVGFEKVDNISLRIEMLLKFAAQEQDSTESKNEVLKAIPNLGENNGCF